jgi:hypothetical protein
VAIASSCAKLFMTAMGTPSSLLSNKKEKAHATLASVHASIDPLVISNVA